MTGTQHTAEQVKQVLDVGAATGTAAALIGWVPSVTAVFTLIYVIVRLYETDTMQRVLKRGKNTQALPPIDPADTSDTD